MFRCIDSDKELLSKQKQNIDLGIMDEDESMENHKEQRTYRPIKQMENSMNHSPLSEEEKKIRDQEVKDRIIARHKKNKVRDRLVILGVIVILAVQAGFYGLAVYLADDDGQAIADDYMNNQGDQVIENYEADTYEDLDAESLNFVALSYLDEERYEEAVEVLLDAEKIVNMNDIDMVTAIYNNLCWGNNGLGNYEEALEYGRKGLDLGDESTYIYTNVGNSYFNLYEFDQAIIMYKKAIKSKEGPDDFVYSNIGESYYQLGDYSMASKWFGDYHRKVPDDPYGLYDLAWSLAMEYNDWERGYAYLERLDGLEEADIILAHQSEFLNYFEVYEESYQLLENQVRSFYIGYPDLTSNFLVAAYYTGNYREGIRVAEEVIEDGSLDLDIWYNLLDLYYMNEEHEKAYDLVSKYDLMTEDSFDTKLEEAYMYGYNFYYNQSAVLLEDLVHGRSGYDYTGDQWENALYEWIYVLGAQENYDKLIQVIRRFQEDTDNINMDYELAYAYIQIGDFDLAKDYLQKSIEVFPDDQLAYGDLVDLLLYDGEADQAEKVIEEMVLRGFPQDYVDYQRQYYEEMVEKSPSDWLFDYIENHYMYLEDPEELNALRAEYEDEDSFSNKDLDRITEIIFGQDIFSYMVYPDEVEMMFDMEETQSVTGVWLNPSDYLLDIDFFSSLTDTEIYRLLSRIEDSGDKNLIIDLRENYGGDADSAYHILDYFLPNLYLGEWDSPIEESYSYYSNGDYFDFNEIIVLVNDHTASSAELIALGLQLLRDNTLVVGQTTYGKGVGQVGNVNMTHGFGVFVVNAYWTIQDVNIHEKGVVPDVETDVSNLQSMIKAARNH